MLIKNYGLFWERKLVFWGRPRVSGAIMGSMNKRDSLDVDFRDQKAIYVLHKNDRIVYIGQTGSGDDGLFSRLRQHTRNHLASRWDQFSWFGLLPVTKCGGLSSKAENQHADNCGALDHFEAILLSIVEPPLNKQGPRWGDKVEQYYQVRHEEIEQTDRELLEEIYNRLSAK